MTKAGIAGLGLMALAACKVPIPAQQNDAGFDDGANFQTVNAAEPVANEAVPGNATAATDGVIPASFFGRWGLVPADCTSTRGDNKGLMTVERDRLSFYKSRAVPTAVKQLSPTDLRVTLAFKGEGQTWTEETPLTLEDGGNALTRVSHDGQTLRYTRCGA